MESITLVSAILVKMSNVSKWQRQFIVHLIPLFMSIKGRINFRQMSRYGCLSATTYRNNLGKSFDFGKFNGEHIKQQGTGHHVILFDPSHIRKSGKHTFGKGRFWSGCDSSIKQGLEIGGIAIGDVEHHTAFHYEALQTPNAETLKKESKNLLIHYAELIIKRKDELSKLSKYLAVDAYFSKKVYVDKILAETFFEIVSRLRGDSVLYYIHDEKPTGKRGRPKLYAGKVDIKNPAMNHFKIVHQDPKIRIFSAIVFAKALGRKIKLALVQYLDEDGSKITSTKLYFSTDLNLPAWYIVKYYKLRFQIEFIYRDAKQFTGLEHCQARSKEKLYFHMNTALTTVSIAKSVHYLSMPKQERESFSMANVKILYHNQLLLERFFDVFGIDHNTHKNNPKVKELYYFGSMAA
jgi:hypothetical protein